MRLFRRSAPSLGRRGENAAAWHLRRRGYRILERNARFGEYEIDIIARRGDTVCFVEVKTRTGDDYALPEENVTRTKRRHIRTAAHRYIARTGPDSGLYYRFDVASVLIPERGKASVTFYPNAFDDDDR